MVTTPRLGLRLLEGTDVANYELINTILVLIDTLVAKQEALAGSTGHTHNGADGNGPKIAYANVTGAPTALPAAGGNADTVDSKHATDFAVAGHGHNDATQAAAGFLSAADKAALDTLAARVTQALTPTSSPTFDVVNATQFNGKVDADTVDGKHVSDLALAGHNHGAATQSVAGFLSAADKVALDLLISRVDQALKSTSSPTFNVVTANKVIGAVYA